MPFLNKPKCPVNDFDKDWIEKSLIWYESKIGELKFDNSNSLIPDKKVFPFDKIDEPQVWEIIKIIASFIDLDISAIDLKIFDNSTLIFSEGLVTENYFYEKTYTQLPNKNGFYEMSVFTEDYTNFPILVKKISFQLVMIKSLQTKILSFINLHMIEMAAIVYGLGLIFANATVTSDKWTGIAYYGWRVQRYGVITETMYGYLFALLTLYKKQPAEVWEKLLVENVKESYIKSINWLKDKYQGNAFLNPEKRMVVNDEDVFIIKTYYRDGGLAIISHLKDGKYEGLMTFYHLNGKLWSERIYKNGISYTVLSNFTDDGEAVEMGTLKEGNGNLYIYENDGRLNRIETYENGVKTGVETFLK